MEISFSSGFQPNLKLNIGNINDHVATPRSLKRQIEIEFGKFYDPCPLHANFNGLEGEWADLNYINPPYSSIKPFIMKAVEEMGKGKSSLVLVPFRPSSKYWNEYVWPNVSRVLVFTDRIAFEGYTSGLPLPIVLLIFGNPKRTKIQKLNWPYVELVVNKKI